MVCSRSLETSSCARLVHTSNLDAAMTNPPRREKFTFRQKRLSKLWEIPRLRPDVNCVMNGSKNWFNLALFASLPTSHVCQHFSGFRYIILREKFVIFLPTYNSLSDCMPITTRNVSRENLVKEPLTAIIDSLSNCLSDDEKINLFA